MGKCSYTWEERDVGRSRSVRKCCQREIWKGSDRFCIFHDPSPEKDVDLFKRAIEEQIEAETEELNFIGYYFPKDWDFTGREFRISANFMNATFQGTVSFWRATFQDTTYFDEVTFQDTTYFWETTFQGTVNFWGATFLGITYFWETTFQDATYFWETTFEKKLEFTPFRNEKVDFRDAEFLSRSKVTANLKEALYQGAFIENIVFIDCRWPEDYVIYEEKHMNDQEIDISFSELETIYRGLKQNMQDHGDYEKTGEFFFREMQMKRKGTSLKKHSRWWLEIYRFLAGYGERPWRTVGASIAIIIFFAFLYGALDCLHYSVENPCWQQKIIDVIYFSFVTFTTLGLGDITPVTNWGKALICTEAVIGAFMIAVFVVVFVRKMAR